MSGGGGGGCDQGRDRDCYSLVTASPMTKLVAAEAATATAVVVFALSNVTDEADRGKRDMTGTATAVAGRGYGD